MPITEKDYEILRKYSPEPEEQCETKIIHKADEKKVVYGVVLEPMTEVTPNGDAHGDVMSEEEIEKTAHQFMASFRQMKKGHSGNAVEAVPVESFIAPCEFELGGQKVKKGSWVLGVHVQDDDIWDGIKKGEINSFSPGGVGRRHPFLTPSV